MDDRAVEIAGNAEDLYRRAAERFVVLAEQAVASAGRFRLALAGGSTPRGLYSLLATAEFKKLPWSQISFFWGDERCVGPDHPDSNFRMAKEALLSKVPVPEENIFRMAGEKEPEEAAAEYESVLKKNFDASEPFPRFDLILLGLGEDGHTASLFPGSETLRETRRWVAAPYVEKLRSHRLTLTLPVLNSVANVIFLVSGEGKAAVLRRLFGEKAAAELPAGQVRPHRGRLVWLADREAVSLLPGSGGLDRT